MADINYTNVVAAYVTAELGNAMKLIEGLDKTKPEHRSANIRKAISLCVSAANAIKNLK